MTGTINTSGAAYAEYLYPKWYTKRGLKSVYRKLKGSCGSALICFGVRLVYGKEAAKTYELHWHTKSGRSIC